MALSKETLEFCDWLIDGVSVSANHPNFEDEAKRVGTAKREITEALVAAGGTPIGVQRLASE